MTGTVWTKFYWSDWETDPALRLCSLAAQGLWMRMLCIAASHDPIGYVCVAGNALDETDLARLTGVSESEARPLITELERNGVCSRDRRGRIYSRRMVRDARKLAEAKKFGREGGNPKLSVGYNKPGFVYLIGRRNDGAYKIGISSNPIRRLTKIRRQYPGHNLEVLDAWHVADMGAKEAEAHKLFSEKAEGEWFFLSGVDIGKLKEFFETLKGPEKGTQKAHMPEARVQSLSVVPSNEETTGGRPPEDLNKTAWRIAVSILTDQGGMTDSSARALFGKLLSVNRVEARDLIGALADASANQTQDPQGYLTRAAAARAKRRPGEPQKRVGFV